MTTQKLRGAVGVILPLLPVGLALFLYREALSLTFYWDDPGGHLLWIERRSALSILTSAEGIAFYRPLPLLLWKALRSVSGGYDPVAFHLLSVLTHGVNVLLVWLVALRLSRRQFFAAMAATLFAAFPYSYEAVAYVGGFFHPLATAFGLGAFLLYLKFRETGRTRDRAGSLFMFLLALLSHEGALVVALIVLGHEMVVRPGHLKQTFSRAGPYFLVAVFFLVVWWMTPKLPRLTGISALPEIATNVLFVLQGWIYPLSYHVRSLAAQMGWSEASTLLALSAILAVTLGSLARSNRRRELLLNAGLWTVLPMLPAAVLLRSDYVLTGPRLFYLSSVGIAMVWALALEALFGLVRHRSWGWRVVGLTSLAIGAGLIARPSQVVISCNLDSYQAVAEFLGEVEEIAGKTDPDQTLTLVNPPLYTTDLGQRGAGCVNPFAYGRSGVLVIPPYPRWLDDYLTVRGFSRSPVVALRVEAFGVDWVTYGENVGLDTLRHFLRQGSATYLFDLTRWGFFDLSGHWRVAGSVGPPRGDSLVVFDDLIALVDSRVTLENRLLEAELHWTALNKPARYYTVFIHVWNAQGEVLAQDDAMPAENYIATIFWEPGDQILDRHTVPLADELPPDHYWAAVGVYDSETQARLTARQPGGPRLQGDLYVIGEFDHPAS